MKTDAEVLQQSDSVEMIKRPHLWPNTVLPLKKYSDKSGMEVAVVIDVVMEGSPMVRLYENTGMYQNLAERSYELVTPEEVVARGWQVD